MFQENFDQQLKRQKLSTATKPFEYQFTLDSLKSLLEQNGFQLVPDAAGNPYTIAKVRYDLDQAISVAENGARMRIIAQMPDLLNTPELADKIIQTAMENTKQQWEQNPATDETKYGPTQAAFVARKIDNNNIENPDA